MMIGAKVEEMDQNSKVVEKSFEYVKKGYREALEKLGSENDMELVPLSVEELNQIHDAMIAAFGGTPEIRDAGLLESVSSAPFQSVFGVDAYPTVFDKAAKYLLDFSRYQIYADGNKRMGIGAASVFLLTNGFHLTLPEESMYNLVMDIATGKIEEVSQVADILKDNYEFLLDSIEDMDEPEL